MRVLYVITSLRTGGAEKLMVDLLPRLKEKGIDVELAVFDGTQTPFMDSLEASGIIVHKFAIGSSVYNPKHIWRLARLMRSFDYVHTHNTAPQLFAVIAKLFYRRKLITTEHSTSNRRRGNTLFRLVDKWMYSRYNTIVCISDIAETNLREHLGWKNSNKICTINNGVDVNRFASASPATELRSMLPSDGRVITMVAGFRHEKDQPTIIRAMKHLPDNFHLFLVGDGVRRDEFENLIVTEGLNNRVHLLGIRSDIPEILQTSDYIVMSSHYEGLSLSNIEGMSVGKPFLASDVDGLREVVSGYGILFPHEDPEALAKEILAFEKDNMKYQEIGTHCKRRALDFDIAVMVQKYTSIYE